MSTGSVVTPLGQIDAAWLTRVLEQAGLARGAEVVEVGARSIGTGQVGENVRFTLRWSSDEGQPASVVGKFPSTSEVSRSTAEATRSYVNEIGFYRDLQSEVTVRTPAVLHLEADEPVREFLLLMEDVTPAEAGDQLLGCTRDRAELALEAAADLHASTWGRGPELAELDWLDPPSADGAAQRSGLYHLLFTGFVERYRDRLSDDEIDLGRWLGEHLPAIEDALRSWPPCLTHNDFRLDNLLFGVGGAAPPVTVVDWQTTRLGTGPCDAAYFVGAGLLPEERRLCEPDLLAHYRRALAERGVTDEIEEAYRLGTVAGYGMAVIASQIVERTERGDDMFVAMATRHAGQMIDADLERLVG